MNETLWHAYLSVTSHVDDLRIRLAGRLDGSNEDGLTSVEIAVIVGLLVAAAIAIVAIIRGVGESAASDIKYK